MSHRSNGRHRIRLPKGPNLTEGRYAELLEIGRIDGAIARYEYEPRTFPLSRSMPPVYRCEYTPDYGVELPDGRLEYHEVKGGHIREDSWIKFKWAVDLYPQYTFVLARRRKDGSWAIERFRGRA